MMLDMGCGDRRCEPVLRLAGHEYVGMDIGGDEPDVLGIGEALPFQDESFDFVFTLSVVPHTAHPLVVMGEIFRVLKPGGRYIGTVEFLEPCHMQSRHHVTALGAQDWLDFSGFDLIELEANDRWLGIHALLQLGFYPRLSWQANGARGASARGLPSPPDPQAAQPPEHRADRRGPARTHHRRLPLRRRQARRARRGTLSRARSAPRSRAPPRCRQAAPARPSAAHGRRVGQARLVEDPRPPIHPVERPQRLDDVVHAGGGDPLGLGVEVRDDLAQVVRLEGDLDRRVGPWEALVVLRRRGRLPSSTAPPPIASK